MQVSKAFVAAAMAVSVGAAAASAPSAPAQAQTVPSFNCKKARTFIEKAICGSPALAAKDRRMSALYFNVLKTTREYGEADDVRELQQAQRRWLARRDRCQTNACVHEAYDSRIRQLEANY